MQEKLIELDTAPVNRSRLYARANFLALFTIFYNLVEGLVSTGFGASDETLSLFGFGVDSFIEVLSAVGVWHMIRRIRRNGGESRDGPPSGSARPPGGSRAAVTGG